MGTEVVPSSGIFLGCSFLKLLFLVDVIALSFNDNPEGDFIQSPDHAFTWQDKVPNSVVLERAGIVSMYTLLKQRCLRWLGHVVRMADGQIPKDLLYGELVQGKRPRGTPQLRYKDICKP